MPTVNMLCLTTKNTFEVVDPQVVLLKGNKYAFRAPCPWPGKRGQTLYAYKFCSRTDYETYINSNEIPKESDAGERES